MGRSTKILVIIATMASMLAAAAAPALALTSDEVAGWIGPKRIPTATYRGAAYYTGGQVGSGGGHVYRWSNGGWIAATFKVGASVQVQPWTNEWMWAWRDNSWFAVHRVALETWSCPGASAQVALRSRTAAYRYNTISSEVKGYLGSGTVVWVGCGQAFAEANPLNWQQAPCLPGYPCPMAGVPLVLVYANPQPSCTVPLEPGGIVCLLAIRNNPHWVYVPKSAFRVQ